MPKVLVLNNYPFEDVWEEVKRGEKPDHHLFGINYFHLRNYEVELVPFKKSPLLQLADKFLRKIPSLVPLGCLDQQWSCIKRFNEADLIYSPCQTQTQLLSYLRALGIIKIPIVCIAHHFLDRGGRLDRFRIPFFQIQIKGVDQFASLSSQVGKQIDHLSNGLHKSEVLTWGTDIDYYPYTPELGRGVVAAGRTGRDFVTFGKAASLAKIESEIICLESFIQEEFKLFKDCVKVTSCPDARHLMYPELMKIYAKARVLAIPLTVSHSLSGLTSLMDVLGMGKPVIMTRQPFIDLDIEAEGIGIWVDNGDVDGWIRAMQYFENYPQQALEMGNRARKLAETRMNSLFFANQVMDIFDSILER
jgi:glycosyltransferase involved in cell wall biosynthesis